MPKMDHLLTEEERKERWYCRTVWPRFLQVANPQAAQYLLSCPSLLGSTAPSFVYGMPYAFLLEDDGTSGLVMQQYFQRNGFLVVSGVLNPDDCEKSLALARSWILAAHSAETKLAKTTKAINIRSVEGGILPYYGAGHSAFAWSVRSHPNVRRVFESLLGTNDLLASLDGVILWEEPPSDFGWFHVDQNPGLKPEAAAIQGLVNLIDVSEGTGGNALVLESHKLFPDHYTSGNHDFYRQRLEEVNGDDWLEIDPNDEMAISADKVVSLCLKAGDMLLWDSRMVHCSYPPKKIHMATATGTLEESRSTFTRAATLVSMMPRKKVTHDVLEHRRRAVDSVQTLTHWVDKASALGAERSEHAAKERKIIDIMKETDPQNPLVILGWANLTRNQRRLVCAPSPG